MPIDCTKKIQDMNSKDNMRETKIYKALQYFNAYELNRFEKFIRSPYFNSNETLIELFRVLREDIKKPQDFLSKLGTYEIIYDERYNDAKLRRTNSQLLGLLERFLAQEVFDQNPLREANFLVEHVRKRKIRELYNSSIKSAIRTSKKQEIKTSQNYYYDYLLESNLHQLREEDLKRFETSNIELISKNLDKFFIIEKLKFYTSKVLTQKSFIQKNYVFHFIEEIKDHLQQNDYKNDPIIQLHYLNLLMFTYQEDENYFNDYKNLLFQSINKLEINEAFDFLIEAINYCIRKGNLGNLNFEKELFDLYQFAVESEILIQSNNFNRWDYRNICIAGLKLKRFDWVKKFNDKYKNYIDLKHRENAYIFNLGLFYFYKKEFDQVITTFQQVEYNDPTYAINSRALLLATYYELDELETMFSFADSFTTYLSRQKELSDLMKTMCRNLIKFTKRLSSVETNKIEKIEKLKNQINNSKQVASKPWLLEKVDELIQRKSK